MPKSVIIPGTSTDYPLAPCRRRGVCSARCRFIKDNNVVVINDPKANLSPRAGDDQNRDRNGGWYDEDVTFNSIFITDWKTTPRLTTH